MMDKKSELEIYQEGLYLLNHVKEVEQVRANYVSRKEELDKQLAIDVPREPLPEKPVSKKNVAKYIVPILIGVGLTALNYYYLEPNRVFDKELAYITTEYNIDSTYLVYFLILAFVLILLVIVGITSITKHKKYKKEIATWELNCDAIETRNKAVLQEDMQEKEKLAGEAKLLELKIDSLDTTIRLSNKRYQEKILPSIEEEDPSPEQLQNRIDELTMEVIEEPFFDIPETENDSITEEIPVIEEDGVSSTTQEPSIREEPMFTVEKNISSTLPEQSEDEPAVEPTIRDPFEDIEEIVQEDNEEEPTVTLEEGGVDVDSHYHPEEDEPSLVIDESTPFTPTGVVEEAEDKSEVEEPEPLFEDEDDSVLTISDIIDEDETAVDTDSEEGVDVEEAEAVEAEKPVLEVAEELPSIDDSKATLEPIETSVEEVSITEDESEDDAEEESTESESDESENGSIAEEGISEPEEVIRDDSEVSKEDSSVKEMSGESESCPSEAKEVSKGCVEKCIPEVTTPSVDLIKQNKEEGYADGVSLEKLATVKRGWKLDMDIKVVSALTDLSEDKIKKIYELFSL